MIARSYIENPNLFLFLQKRILRIYPAFLVVVFAVPLILGPIVTTLPLSQYFTDAGFLSYFLNVFLYEIYHLLPGVFEKVPCPVSVNASLWTLPVEFFMYVLIAIWGTLKVLPKKWFCPMFIIFMMTLFAVFWTPELSSYKWIKLLRLGIIFFCSSYLYILKDKIFLSFRLFIVFTAMYFLSQYYFTGLLPEFVRFITLPYIVIYAAYAKIPYINKFGKYGDFSYGLYVWAFPVQQTLVYYFHDNLNFISYNICVFMITMIFAVLSYYFVEKPALQLKKFDIADYLFKKWKLKY